ncbi:MAG: hypothetical protein H6618_01135 [Deltaproteobacteria bacterium]|nr:hypothetical protein [Deltaproteobacteria bacterium]
MGDGHGELTANREFVQFINQYSEVIELQLIATQQMMEHALSQVMDNLQHLSSEIETESKTAEKFLEETYLSPDDDTNAFVSSIQGSVDALVNEAWDQLCHGSTKKDEESRKETKDLRQFGERFSKQMEALSTLDSEISSIIYKMISALSNDDVIRQKLEHLLLSVHALKVGLAYILTGFRERFTLSEVDMFRKNLLKYTYRLYTSEQEKEIFQRLFPVPE